MAKIFQYFSSIQSGANADGTPAQSTLSTHGSLVIEMDNGTLYVFRGGKGANGNLEAVVVPGTGVRGVGPYSLDTGEHIDIADAVSHTQIATVSDAAALGMLGQLESLAAAINAKNIPYIPFGPMEGQIDSFNSNAVMIAGATALGVNLQPIIGNANGLAYVAIGIRSDLPGMSRSELMARYDGQVNSDGSWSVNVLGNRHTFLNDGFVSVPTSNGSTFAWRDSGSLSAIDGLHRELRVEVNGAVTMNATYNVSRNAINSNIFDREANESFYADGQIIGTSKATFSTGGTSPFGSDFSQTVEVQGTKIVFGLNHDGFVIPTSVLQIGGVAVPVERQQAAAEALTKSGQLISPESLITQPAQIAAILSAYDSTAPANQVGGAIDNTFSATTNTSPGSSEASPIDPSVAINANNSTLIGTTGISTWSIDGVGNVNTASGNTAYANNTLAEIRVGDFNLVTEIQAGSLAQSIVANPGLASSSVWNPEVLAAVLNVLGSGLMNAIPTDPLILDLNGDGVKLTSYAQRVVLFDIDNDGGSKEITGWVAANTITTGTIPAINTDGIVVWDPSNTGVISNISQTFSEYFGGNAGSNGNAGTKPYANGFAALKSLDAVAAGGNNDGHFTSADALWSSVKVWVDDNADGISFKDTNGNGIRDAGEATELHTLAELGITDINLASSTQSGLVNGGNEVLATGSFTINGQQQDTQATRLIANPTGNTVTQSGAGASGATVSAEDGQSSYVSTVTPGTNNAGESIDVTQKGVKNAYGSAGNDTLTGDAGANWLAGGQGSDTFFAGAGDDVLLIDAADLQANIHAGAGIDIAQIIGDQGVTLNLTQAEIEIVQGGAGNDVLIGGGRSSVFIRGGGGDDILIGGAANDALSGEDGNDLIDGGAGNDLIRGQRGQDALLGGAGNDIADGGLDDDRISGGTGNDVLKGSQGDDTIDGGDGIDIAEYSGSFADYRITRLGGVPVSQPDGSTTGSLYRVVDLRAGRSGGNEGADTLTNIEKLNFADISAVDLTQDNPLPVKDVLTIADRTGLKLISAASLLANDQDWQGDARETVAGNGFQAYPLKMRYWSGSWGNESPTKFSSNAH